LDKYQKASFYSLIWFFIISVLVTAIEYPMITVRPDFYLFGKILFHLWQIRLCFQFRKNAYSISNNLQAGTLMMLYCIHGQYFSPWYLFGYHQLIIAFSFLFPLPKKIFNVFAAIAMIAFLSMMWWRFQNVYSWINESSRVDWLLACIAITLVAVLSHSFFTTDRNHRETLVRKFGLVGLQTATVVHDVKGLLASPRMNLDLLKKQLQDTKVPEVQHLISTTEAQLRNMSEAIQGLTQIVALQQQELEPVNLLELVHEVAQTLNLSGRKVQLSVDGEGNIVTEKALLKSMVFNVLMNSVQAFRKSQISDPSIEVRCGKDILAIADNAGGYSQMILKTLQTDESERTNTSGMGLFLISTGMQSIGGRAVFENKGRGAKVTMHFPDPLLPKRFPFLP
jgi:signal transduction histidine kinase